MCFTNHIFPLSVAVVLPRGRRHNGRLRDAPRRPLLVPQRQRRPSGRQRQHPARERNLLRPAEALFRPALLRAHPGALPRRHAEDVHGPGAGHDVLEGRQAEFRHVHDESVQRHREVQDGVLFVPVAGRFGDVFGE